MVLRLSISAEAEASLKAKAMAAGVDVATYAARYLELLATPTAHLKDLAAATASAFGESGMSEASFADLLEHEKHALRAERRARPAG